jgi:hypothetical protein
METMTEQQMRDHKVPWFKTAQELSEYIEGLIEQEHDYGTSAYAMSLAAVAAFQYVASAVGATGFQASCADLDIIRRTRRIDGPFILLKGDDALYPQYDLHKKLSDFLSEIAPYLKDAASKKIHENNDAHPDVMAHWKKLAE